MTRYLHTMYRITDPERSRAFYEALGFEYRRDHPIVRDDELEATNYFFGLPGQEEELELTFNHDGRTYEPRHRVRPRRPRRRRPRRDARPPRRAGHRARAPAVHGPRGRLAPLLRPRPGRLPHRAHRARRIAPARPVSTPERVRRRGVRAAPFTLPSQIVALPFRCLTPGHADLADPWPFRLIGVPS